MVNYDLSELNPIEFEELVNDLISYEEAVKVERFSEWRDKGIDGRFVDNQDEINIIQSKHYIKSGKSALFSALEKEVEKVKKLFNNWELDKYIIATSLELSVDNKYKIFQMFSPYIKNKWDIYSLNDLNSLLSKHKEVEKKYLKLYLKTPWILEKTLSSIVNNDVEWRSRDLLESYIEKRKFFYETEDYKKAFESLLKNNVLIITWEPWIWKSTLSEQICLKIITDNLDTEQVEFLKIDEIVEAEKVWNDNERQIFYFDDFLWSNYLEKIEWKDSKIKNFIDKIVTNKSKSSNKELDIKDKYFILNSRTTVLNSWLENSAKYWFKKIIRDNEFILEVKNLLDLEKAYILYNHLFYSNLKREYIDNIFKDKNYKKVIAHKNYNPRIIEFITKDKHIELKNSESYIDFVIRNLDNPEEVWENVFEKQSTPYINYLIYCIILNWWSLNEDYLKENYNSYLENNESKIIPEDKKFNFIIKIAIKNFLVRSEEKLGIFYSLINPSISDYILSKNKDDDDFWAENIYNFWRYNWIKTLYELSNWKQYNFILNWYHKGYNYISKDIFNKVIKNLFEKWIEDKEDDYVIILYKLVFDNFINDKNNLIIKYLQDILNGNYIDLYYEENIHNLLFLINKNIDKLKIDDISFMEKYIREVTFSSYNLSNINWIFKFIDNKEELLDEIYHKIEVYILDEIYSDINDINFSDYYDKFTEDCDISSILEKFTNIDNIKSIMDESWISMQNFKIEKLDIDILESSIEDMINERLKDFKESLHQYDSDDNYDVNKEVIIDDIDALFSKNF